MEEDSDGLRDGWIDWIVEGSMVGLPVNGLVLGRPGVTVGTSTVGALVAGTWILTALAVDSSGRASLKASMNMLF